MGQNLQLTSWVVSSQNTTKYGGPPKEDLDRDTTSNMWCLAKVYSDVHAAEAHTSTEEFWEKAEVTTVHME